MKKLLIASMTVALAAGAWADFAATSETFENIDAGALTIEGQWAASEDTGAKLNVTAYGEGETAPASIINTADNTKYLSFDTAVAKPFWRTLDSAAAAISVGDGYVFDALVQFTAADSAPEAAEDDRFLLWLQAGDTANTLMVTCGTTDPIALDKTIAEGTWARVSIKSIKVGEGVGFIVFIDGAAVAAKDYTGVYTTSPTEAEAKGWYDQKMLFPSKATGATLKQVGFSGTGKIDDLQIVTAKNAPDFTQYKAPTTPIAPGETKTFNTAEDAAAYVAAGNLKTPDCLTSDTAKSAYKALFAATTTQSGTEWVVSYNLTEDGTTAVQNTTDALVVQVTGAEVTATGAEPGFYYAIQSSATESFTDATTGTWIQAGEDGNVTFPAVTTDADAQFFKVVSKAYLEEGDTVPATQE